MAQDSVDNSGWQNHLRYISVWGPLAAIQLSTIGGLGYFYGRLESIDQTSTTPPIITTTLKVEPTPQVSNSYPLFNQSPKVTQAALHIPATLVAEPNMLTMQVGENFASEAAKSDLANQASHQPVDAIQVTPKPTTLLSTPSTSPVNKAPTPTQLAKVDESKLDKPDSFKALKKAQLLTTNKTDIKEKSASKASIKTDKPTKALETKKVEKKLEKSVETKKPERALEKPIEAKKSEKALEKSIEVKKSEKLSENTRVKSAKLPKLVKVKRERWTGNAIEKSMKSPNKSNTLRQQDDNGRWVYLGELRDYGWYGQKLHVAPNSGLPNIGQTYRTQLIHGTYDQPRGNRSMGGFQQGDVVQVENVQQESDGKVWAKLSKVHDVGRFDE